jgi:hypothetical protein
LSTLLLALLAAAPETSAWTKTVRPMLVERGCGSAECHGKSLIPFRFEPWQTDAKELAREEAEALSLGKSGLLLGKATGVKHYGGRGLEPGGCEVRAVQAWLDGNPASPCAQARTDVSGTVPNGELNKVWARCVTAGCHDVKSPVLSASDSAANRQALAPFALRFLPSDSRLFKAVQGNERHPAVLANPKDAGWRALWAFATESRLPSKPAAWEAFEKTLNPMLLRRGCGRGSCHGFPEAPLVLSDAPVAAADNFMRLLLFAEAGTFPKKPRNEVAHGGGPSFVSGDCVDTQVARWLSGKSVMACAPPPAPDKARFATVVQPALGALTCQKCHKKGLASFHFTADAAQVEADYQAVVKAIDTEFPPGSRVLARVRESCLQSKILSWVAKLPDPGCAVQLKNFQGDFPSVPQGNP